MSLSQINELLQKILENHITQLLIGGFVIFIVAVFLQRLVRSVLSRTTLMDGKESDTVISLLQSVIKYIAILGFLFFALSIFGLDVGGMLAGAGVLGIIIGFGAQSLVQDLLAGFFIVYEKQLQKGDWVIVNEKYEGIVEEVGFRVLKIRDWSATIISINNGQVTSVENFNKSKMRVLERVTVSYYEDPTKVLRILEDVCTDINHELRDYLKQNISGQPIEPFSVLGVDSVNDQHQGYRYIISGLVGDLNYFGNARTVKTIIAKHMFKNQIKMPHQAIHITDMDQHNGQ
ncbi:Small-conductance mechanosensitive channel [Halolactibacillus halophilus]|uniref:MscS family protein YfkC n=1 Tax=Halolactibacillus halophilus TaxID=306540 RepID=A0A1I5N120_9BACI|nr:mechanosensitive ion channel family protein [Halolactibacillus halophilus]GEM01098.1 putative MscS family protein YfkC [Halolactibacillus halophilus]SFP15483.1 Small-conductance mechanosensitive channel [Halolactibacillus halophilus]